MAVRTEWLTTQTSHGPMGVYLARPDDDQQHPGVVVIQEIFGVNDHIQDVTGRFAAEGFVAAAPEVRRGQIGIVGFCYGGRVAYLAAARNPELRAAVCFYGGRIVADDPSAPINASADIQAPMLLFFGEKDQSIPLDQIERIRETLTRLKKPHEIVVYPDAGHGFFCDARPGAYNPQASADAWPRTLAFFRQHLGT